MVVEEVPGGVAINVRVTPRAGRAGVAGIRDDRLVVRLHAPPVEGAANEELIEVLSRALSVPKRSVSIVAGARSRQKRVRVAGLSLTSAPVARLIAEAGTVNRDSQP